jgi:ABC-2 type transport system ATP-binding protein
VDPVARLTDVSHSYGRHQALLGVTWQVPVGVVGVVGVNGAGKSTLLRILATSLRPTQGEVQVLGRSTRSPGEVRRRIGVMPQSADLPREVTVDGFLAYVAWLRAIPRSQRKSAIGDALELADLADRRSSRIGSLSGGMVRRLLLAQAVLAKPELLILDEPTAGLDPEQRVRLRQTIGSLGWPGAVVVSSHLMEDLVPIADRVLMLDAGGIAFDGTVAELRTLGEDRTAADADSTVFESAFLALRVRGQE